MSSTKTSSGACVAIFIIAVLAATSLSLGTSLFDVFADQEAAAHRLELRKALGVSLHPGVRAPSLGDQRRVVVAAALEPIFKTLPRNRRGRMSAAVARYTVHRFFNHKYGWNVAGFEPFRPNTTSLGDALILKDKVPKYAEGILEDTLSDRGFQDQDIVMLVAAVEQLIFDHVVESTESAYTINGQLITKPVRRRAMVEILNSVIIEGMLEGNFSSPRQHMVDKQNIREIYPEWETMRLFVEDVISADDFEAKHTASPFARGSGRTYAFEDTARLSTRVAEELGPWSNYECGNMKEALSNMDPHAAGRVRLQDFYKASLGGHWHFSESMDYLSQLGALDNSSAELGPQVIIPNYLTSMSNCVYSTHYYSTCCMNECHGIRHQLEGRIQAPSASAGAIAHAVEEIWSRNLTGTTTLADLQEVAAQNGGQVPLHSWLFEQWLHFTFPRECPYPYHPDAVVTPQTPGKVIEQAGEEAITIQDKDLYAHLKTAVKPPSPKAGASMRSKREANLQSSTPDEARRNWLALLIPAGAGVALLVVLAKAVKHACRKFQSEAKATPEIV